MYMNDAIRIIKPEPDSQFRLVPCPECKSDDVAYEAYSKGNLEPWRVRCFGCGRVVDKHAECRHDAQRFWNSEVVS